MPLGLLRFAWAKKHPEPRMFRRPLALKKNYDCVVIGGGGHGLATAYYLARDHGMRNIAVLEKAYLGGGNTGRNTTIVRSNYLTTEGVKFYQAAIELWKDLSEEFGLNLFYAQRGHYTLAHTDASMRTLRLRAEVNKHLGVESEMVDRAALRAAIPMMDLECGGNLPVLGALHHAPGAIVRHDAVAWGYAKGADALGVEIHQQTEVLGIEVSGGKIRGVRTTQGSINTPRIVCAVAGSTPRLTNMVGLRTPIFVHPLQAMVSEPMKPWLDPIVVSGSLHVYISQSARGELVMGAALDPYELHATRSTLEFAEQLSAHLLELFPFLSHAKVMRQWAGMADMTPDFAPIMGKTEVGGFYLDAGWGTWGFKATPISGKTMAYTVAQDRDHNLSAPFSLNRFAQFAPLGEKGAAAVGH